MGCTDNGPQGKYVSEKNPDSFLRLDENSLYTLQENDYLYVGHYTYDNEYVYLEAVMGALRLERDGKTLVDKDGDLWSK